MIPPMLELITRLKSEVVDCQPSDRVMQIQECQKAMTRAAVAVGMKRLTHHDLRHFFVTVCVESGVDVSTIAEWAGHADKGALILKTYTNIRREHLSNRLSTLPPMISGRSGTRGDCLFSVRA